MVCPIPMGWGPTANPDARKTLIKALSGKRTFEYLYDFGNSWCHRIKVKKILPAIACPQVPYCIDGANACPPEDVGGGLGYKQILEAMTNPDHPAYKAMVEWHGDFFDPAAFECANVNPWLKRIKV